MSDEHITKVGVGLLIIKDKQVLLGKRKGSHGAGEYAVVGGHLEYLESFEAAIRRELAEEVGSQLKVKNLRFLCLINLKHYRPKHYVDIGFVADWESGDPKLMEPERMESWQWYALGQLPSPMFVTDPLYIEAYRTGKNYFEI